MGDFIEKFRDLVSVNPEILHAHSADKSYEEAVLPKCVVTPETDDDIRDILRYANEHKHVVTVRGAGSGKSGGAVPEINGIAINMEHFNKIIELDLENSCMVVQPGVIVDQIKEKAEEKGLWYPPDPSSSDWCMIGGNIAENAGGAAALKYGVTGDYVLGIEGFFGNGEPFKFGGKCVKDVAGYDIKRLIIGSEGTLAIITKIILKLIPKPRYEKSIWCSFNSLEDGSSFLRQMMRSSIRFSAAEFMEKECIDAVELVRKERYECNQGQANVLLRMDAYSQEEIDVMMGDVRVVLARFSNAQLFDGDDSQYWMIRRAISEALGSKYKHKISEDITVPPGEISRYLKALKAFESEDGMVFVAYGHLGDGNIHTNILNDALTKEEWNDKKETWVQKVMELCVELGGTLTGEHGIGLSKKKYVSLFFTDQEIKIMKDIKTSCDPNNILNPSKIFMRKKMQEKKV
ncbi:glycolate oxidase subunit GlcD [Candidatus Marinamargulisbacteria bacterium SCGC AG-343-D04]|nr:glycolate oxidase subunit GlcD [Candidatus Marinamargulisbacteria bacterium SCGC AG-343-D04]